VKPASPPRLAIWLLVHLTWSERREAVLGDLLERFAEGETACWFWRQALSAFSVAMVRAIRRHGWSFAAALAVASLVLFAVGIAGSIAQLAADRWKERLMWSLYPASSLPIVWRIAFWAIWFSLQCLGFAVAGWIAARICRGCPRLVVCTFAGFHLLSSMPWMIEVVKELTTNRRYLEGLVWYSEYTFVTTLAILLAGFWSARHYSRNERPSDRRAAGLM
jgi:hypothetical protein